MKDLVDQTAFITGGARGIGLGIARSLAAAGSRLALVDLDQPALDLARDELAETARVETYRLDVQDREEFAQVADLAEDQLGPVSMIINNAGIGSAVPLDGLDYADWDRVLGVNLGGTVNGLQTFLPRMIKRGGPGHVVNVASGAGLVASNKFLYVASKFAVVGLTESLSQQQELRDRGFGVTLVCPGIVRTDVLSRMDRSSDAPATAAREEMFQRFGLSPEVVGHQVVDAIKNDRLYVHTDRMLIEPIRQRTAALLDAMPAETDRDREIAAAFEDQIASVIRQPMAAKES